MSTTSQDRHSLLAQNAEQRSAYLLTALVENKIIWTLVDDDGAMILTTDEEDCIPVWPDDTFAMDWVNDEWSHCRAHSISLDEWQQRWLPGLEEDEIQVALFPLPAEEGLIMAPWEMAEKLGR